jgi:hypothetical protein
MVQRITNYFIEHAKALSDIKAMLNSGESIVKEHLIKLYFWRDSDTKNHWEGEIYGNIPELTVIKGSKKLLSNGKILECIYSYSEVLQRQTPRSVERVEFIEPNLPTISEYITSKDCYNFKCFCDEFFDYVSTELSKVGNLSKRKTYEILDKLLNKYPLYLKN